MTPGDPRWLTVQPGAPCRARLLCLSHAGGPAAAFRPLRGLLPGWLEVRAFEAPGKGARGDQPPAASFAALADEIAAAALALRDRPLALLGHSLGGLLAHAVAQRLTRAAAPPDLLVIAGVGDPGALPPVPDAVNDEALLAFADELGGLPAALRADRDLWSAALAGLRGDLELLRSYRCDDLALTCPTLVIGGVLDRLASPERLEPWERRFLGPFSLSLIDGEHFFIQDNPAGFARAVARDLHRLADTAHPLPTQGCP